MTNELDVKISELNTLERQIANLTEAKENIRKEVLGILEQEDLQQYKNDVATVSYVEKKAIKIKDEESLLRDLQSQKLVKYYKEVPAHLELNDKFSKDVKEGLFEHPEIEVASPKSLAIRFSQ